MVAYALYATILIANMSQFESSGPGTMLSAAGGEAAAAGTLLAMMSRHAPMRLR